jgi:hypothetical protein
MTLAMGLRWDWGLTARLVSLGWTLSETDSATERSVASGREPSGWPMAPDAEQPGTEQRGIESRGEFPLDAGGGLEDELPDLTTLEAWECRAEARRC